MDTNRYFYKRNFSASFSSKLHKLVYEFFAGKMDPEIADFESLKETASEKKRVTIYISGRKSKIEQFLLNGFMVKNGIEPPTHSFGPRTLFFRPCFEIRTIILSLFKKSAVKNRFIESLYVPVDSPEELALSPVFGEVYRKIKHKEAKIVPVITLWDKNLDKRGGQSWIDQFIGKYNFWSTFWELLMLVVKRRKLTLRIDVPTLCKLEQSEENFIKRLYQRMNTAKRNVVGAVLKNWLDLKNDALFAMNLEQAEEKKEALKRIDSLATAYSPLYAEVISSILGKLLNARFSRFDYCVNEINELRKLCAISDANTIFVPTHKSYFDYLLLNYLLYKEKVTVPLAAAGDNLDFFPLSIVLRKMGIFFIRRRIKDDPFYQKMVAAYLKQIVVAGYNMEFFIEGGRSRSGMVRSPRTGMLEMLAEITRSSNRNLYIVPVSISYEKLKEIEDYQKEQTGVKAPESEHFLQKVFALFKANYGPVYIRFSQPIYLKSKFTEETAFKIAELQERSSVVTFSSLFSALFFCFEKLEIKELLERMEFCVETLKRLPYIQVASALKNLDVNCSKMTGVWVKKGILEVVLPEKKSFKLVKEAIYKISFYKNSIAFALAPFFCEILKNSKHFQLVSQFLETIIMGYYQSLNREYEIEGDSLPEWFKIMLYNFFADKFLLLRKTISLLIENKEKIGDSCKTHTALVEFLNPFLILEIAAATKDEIFEAIFFLEKRGILSENLSKLDEPSAADLLGQLAEIIEVLKQKQYF